MSSSVTDPSIHAPPVMSAPRHGTVRMRLAFVAVSYVARRDGISVYTESLLLALLRQGPALEVDVFVCDDAAAVLSDVLRRVGVADRVRLVAVAGHGMLARYVRVPLQVRWRGPYRCVFVPNLQPLWLPARGTVGVLHDLTYRVAWPLFPRWRRRYMDLLTRFWLWRGTTIACISRTTERDLKRYYPASRSRTGPYLPNGLPAKLTARPRPARQRAESRVATTPTEFIFVGRLNRLKGLDRVRHVCLGLDEYGAIQRRHFIVHVVGKETSESEELLEGLRLRRVRLIRHGYLDDPTLNALYRRSGFCLLLSRNEGFGLPLLEAIWQRCVPLLSDIAIFREIMGPGYPLFTGGADGVAALVDFVHRVQTEPLYRRQILRRMEQVLVDWQGGYDRAARNLLAWMTEPSGQTGDRK